jgi:nitrile hydratase accessory protein
MPIFGSLTLNSFEELRDVIALAKCTMPTRQEGEPLFRQPWHARIFAVMVVLVKDQRLEWKTFQKRLVAELQEHQSPDGKMTPAEVDLQYFDCWLEAAEETLLESGFLSDADIVAHIGVIRKTVNEIRNSQLDHHH